MSGPRLQSNLVEGCEGAAASVMKLGYGGLFGLGGETRLKADPTTKQPFLGNDAIISDMQDGRQLVTPANYMSNGYSAGSRTSKIFGVRYALKTTTPNMYVVISLCDTSSDKILSGLVARHQVGDGAFDYPEQTLTVELPVSEWRSLNGGLPKATAQLNGTYNTIANDISKVKWASTDQNLPYDDRKEDSGCTFAKTVSATTVTLTFKFAKDTSFSYYYNSALDIWPLNLASRKMGGPHDLVKPRTKSWDFLAKIWSPIKNCYCLKNMANGEIPILNE